VPDHPGLGRLHAEPLPRLGDSGHRTAAVRPDQRLERQAARRRARLRRHPSAADGWEHADTAPFTFVDGVEKAIAAANEFAGDRLVDVAAGQIGSPALKLG
jgi:hypothetical protein